MGGFSGYTVPAASAGFATMVGLTATIMAAPRWGSHTVTRLTIHLVSVAKSRYAVVQGAIQTRCQELIIQVCDAEDVTLLKGAVSKDDMPL